MGGVSPKFSTLKINYTATEYKKKDYQKQKMRSKISVYIIKNQGGFNNV